MRVNDKEYQEYLKTPKWHNIAKQRMAIDNFECQGCGSRGTAWNPLEVHHFTYEHLYHEESRIYEDLVTLCRCCHKNVHNVMNRVTNAQGRRGWKDNCNVPKVHIFTLSGADTSLKIGDLI